MKYMADWEKVLKDREKAELQRARIARDASASVLRELTRKLKDRCIKRLHRGIRKDG